MTKKLSAILVLILCMACLSSALAGKSVEKGSSGVSYQGNTDLWKELNDLPPFKFNNHAYGIGYGSCPVYSAPSEDAYRCANGKATCDTNSKMADGGFVSGWLLVRYETNKGNYRVGYIPPKYVRGFSSQMAPHFGFIPAVANDTIIVTDNPLSHTDSFAELDPGEEFYILSKYNYYQKNGFDWWYIQCVVDGQVACGFIDTGTSSFTLGGTGY